MTETMGDYEGFGGDESAERNDDAFQEITPDKTIHRAVEKVFLEMSGVLSYEDGITKAIDYICGMCDVKSVMAYPNIHPMIPTLYPNYSDSTNLLLNELLSLKTQLLTQIEVLNQRIAVMERWKCDEQRVACDGK